MDALWFHHRSAGRPLSDTSTLVTRLTLLRRDTAVNRVRGRELSTDSTRPPPDLAPLGDASADVCFVRLVWDIRLGRDGCQHLFSEPKYLPQEATRPVLVAGRTLLCLARCTSPPATLTRVTRPPCDTDTRRVNKHVPPATDTCRHEPHRATKLTAPVTV